MKEPLETLYSQIKEKALLKNINLEVMFKDFDHEQSGRIKKSEFLYLMWMYFDINETKADSLANCFDFQNNDQIYYQFLIKEIYTKPLEEEVNKQLQLLQVNLDPRSPRYDQNLANIAGNPNSQLNPPKTNPYQLNPNQNL